MAALLTWGLVVVGVGVGGGGVARMLLLVALHSLTVTALKDRAVELRRRVS